MKSFEASWSLYVFSYYLSPAKFLEFWTSPMKSNEVFKSLMKFFKVFWKSLKNVKSLEIFWSLEILKFVGSA
jgi:hypothetical protein